jgi:hypothetical protein
VKSAWPQHMPQLSILFSFVFLSLMVMPVKQRGAHHQAK